uniref:Uncharacterized protein n=1 Tax=Anguilla anguilla TaxID=7936 RepID=A0A0E9X8U6_ANGAN
MWSLNVNRYNTGRQSCISVTNTVLTMAHHTYISAVGSAQFFLGLHLKPCHATDFVFEYFPPKTF